MSIVVCCKDSAQVGNAEKKCMHLWLAGLPVRAFAQTEKAKERDDIAAHTVVKVM